MNQNKILQTNLLASEKKHAKNGQTKCPLFIYSFCALCTNNQKQVFLTAITVWHKWTWPSLYQS